MSGRKVFKRIDWLTVLFYLLLVGIGWLNIYSSTFSGNNSSVFDFSQLYGKQLIFIGLSLISILVILALEASFYERFSSVLYIISMALLLGLFVFGKT
ncbi:rod shape-determining protein RodA, partial [bacterium]|nr:rod shape-determining protein RodA [bacterium]